MSSWAISLIGLFYILCFSTWRPWHLASSRNMKHVLNTPDRHDDVIKWRHFPRYWPFVRGIHRSPVNSPHKDQWHGVLMFSLICAWINGWVNYREAGDLRRHCAHHDFTVMVVFCTPNTKTTEEAVPRRWAIIGILYGPRKKNQHILLSAGLIHLQKICRQKKNDKSFSIVYPTGRSHYESSIVIRQLQNGARCQNAKLYST